MRGVINVVLIIVGSIGMVVSCVVHFFALYRELTGYLDLERLLQRLNVPLSYEQIIGIGNVALVIMCATVLIRAKLQGRF